MSDDTIMNGNVVPLGFLETTQVSDPVPKSGEGQKILESSSLLSVTASPPTLLVHGLDSSSHTWSGLLNDLAATGLKAVAVDQRGCGKSPLGDPDRFSPDALVDDLYAFLSSHPLFCCDNGDGDALLQPFVLVGHSMGGRVAMSFAAKHPELIAALVIEDMDVRSRSLSTSHIRSKDRKSTLAFDRNLNGISTPEDVVAALCREGYPSSQVEKWLSEGRVEAVTASDDRGYCYYSQVNPAFRLLCYEQFFETNHGEETWKQLAAIEGNEFPIHLMIADPTMTICDEASVSVMNEAMEKKKTTTSSSTSSSSSLLKIHRYPGATHSIHNSLPEDFTNDLKEIIEEARKQRV